MFWGFFLHCDSLYVMHKDRWMSKTGVLHSGGGDDVDQWSCLTLGGYHRQVLHLLSTLGGWTWGLTSSHPRVGGWWFYPLGAGEAVEIFLRVETVTPLTSPLLKFCRALVQLLLAEKCSGELPDRSFLAVGFISHSYSLSLGFPPSLPLKNELHIP